MYLFRELRTFTVAQLYTEHGCTGSAMIVARYTGCCGWECSGGAAAEQLLCSLWCGRAAVLGAGTRVPLRIHKGQKHDYAGNAAGCAAQSDTLAVTCDQITASAPCWCVASQHMSIFPGLVVARVALLVIALSLRPVLCCGYCS